jgi:hypothetical protein
VRSSDLGDVQLLQMLERATLIFSGHEVLDGLRLFANFPGLDSISHSVKWRWVKMFSA